MEVTKQAVRFIRPRLVEEFSANRDGVRQDFVVLERPPPAAQRSRLIQSVLQVELVVSGAKVEPRAGGVELVLEHSGRKIAYGQLRVTDAAGKELSARMEIRSATVAATRIAAWNTQPSTLDSRPRSQGFPPSAAEDSKLFILVSDADAVYPLRIDPTFSDANWISMGGLPGADGGVGAAVTDGAGNLYVGGEFTVVGGVVAGNIAKWDGGGWSALGSGINGAVNALAVSGSNLYVGGVFTTAGGVAATNIANWDGSSWRPLGSGVNGSVSALGVVSGDLYAGGTFTTVGGVTV
ncbi:MAG: hypothetical protein KGS61_17010, partial [Verrucomicrobia bacterium]|nr:hypothetical protein [Verrucomicrobiota bacterium]